MYNVYVYTVYVYTCIIPVGVDTKLQLQPAMVHDLDHNPISLNHVGKLPMFQTPEVDGFGATNISSRSLWKSSNGSYSSSTNTGRHDDTSDRTIIFTTIIAITIIRAVP